MVPSAALASSPRLDVRASLTTAGCKTVVSGSTVTVSGCSATGGFSGTSRGRISFAYGAAVDLLKGSGTQRGTVTLYGAAPSDLLVLRFSGRVTVSTGGSRGTWRAVARHGAFVRGAPRRGTYSSRSPDQGAHVTIVLRG